MHRWLDRKFRGFTKPITCCQNCGILKRADGKNKPCPGKVRVELRENRIKTGAF